ncbi:hypothetical protein COLO4_04749 [Corchorus olitorius]|uniref:Uncharacterized protein n=1 Tax=Corchorus olitorius TaxID=93759 RepID=A0A1R3KSZ5_9ROSI|nr:hypothetical protein COLO4_04749 [Corchorus olitorius]
MSPTLRRLFQALIGINSPRFDGLTRDTLLIWLEFNPAEIPAPQEAMKMIQHRKILQELYTRGLNSFSAHIASVKSDVLIVENIDFHDLFFSFEFAGNIHQAFLFKTPPSLGLRFNVQSMIQQAGQSTVYSLEFILHLFDAAPQPPSCNTTNFQSTFNQHWSNLEPHLAIITETRLHRSAAKPIIEMLAFDDFEWIDALGYVGGIWVLWNKDTVNVGVKENRSFTISADIKAVETGPPMNSA